MAPEQDGTFRVIDRRLFNAEGELRPEIAEQEEKARQATETAGKNQNEAQRAPAPDTPAVEAPRPSPGVRNLIDFLYQNAAMFLGAYADPRTGQPMLDLDSARDLIDMIDALREKTSGRLAAEEDQMLADRLGRLKLTYLEVTKATAQAMREKTGRKP